MTERESHYLEHNPFASSGEQMPTLVRSPRRACLRERRRRFEDSDPVPAVGQRVEPALLDRIRNASAN
jgi:hypothetical protein